MRRSIAFSLLAAAGVLLLPQAAFAHPNHEGSSLWAGFAHPLFGFDHLLAMIAVGLWAVQLGGRAVWAVPAAFVAGMFVSGMIGMSHIFGAETPAFVEQAIMASVLLLGLAIAGTLRLPVWGGAALVAAFAMFHGYAHGAELPQGASAVNYGSGFIVATAMLHAAGVGLGLLAGKLANRKALRVLGGAIAVAGAGLWLTMG